jgi:serine/threonine protein kinase
MQTIRLERGEWEFDETDRLGPKGGFGEVFRGRGPDGEVAVKRLLMSAGAAAHREMTIGATLATSAHKHVVPVFDFGLDANGDSYYLIMPVCERSLQDVLTSHGSLPWDQAKPIILEIIAGLQEVPSIVHRDLKPGNVLYLNGRWQIADFGIAKFVEDSTSLNTLRESLTPPYAAPEQWLGERPTGGTDVYALGCIIYTLLQGRPPFTGEVDDVRQAHLHMPPPPLSGIDSRLGGLLNVMLRKTQASRPSLERCKAQISSTDNALPTTGPRAALAAAGHAVEQANATAEAQRLAVEAAAAEWRAIGDEGSNEFDQLMKRLAQAIIADASSAEIGKRMVPRVIRLGPAQLKWQEPSRLQRQDLGSPRNPTGGPWEVAAYSIIELHCHIADRAYHNPLGYTFAVTVAFARTSLDPEFRWREISFFRQFSASMELEPTALPPTSDHFAIALSPVMSNFAVAHGPYTVDAEDEEAFIERWTGLFAKAAHGNLRPPNQLPLSSIFYQI